MTGTDPPLRPARDRCAILLAHALDDATLARWREWESGCGATHDTLLVLTTQARAAASALGLTRVLFLDPSEIFLPDYLPKSGSRKIVPGNPDLVLLALWRRLPSYRFYLVSEYDVFFPGGVSAVQAADAASGADLIGADLRTPAEDPDWVHWRGLVVPATHGPAAPHGILLCMGRYSAPLFEALDQAYRSGWNGHFEVLVPTVAAARGLVAETWNDAAARAGAAPITHRGSFHWRRMRPVAQHLAHHPVKTQGAARAVAEALGLPPPREVPPW